MSLTKVGEGDLTHDQADKWSNPNQLGDACNSELNTPSLHMIV